jgi:hypothetical protein
MSVAQVETRAADEHAVVGNERHGPADCGGRDPLIGVVTPLMQSVASHSTLVSKLRDMLDRLVVNRHYADSGGQPRKLIQPPRAPAAHERTVPRVGNGLRSHGDPTPERVLAVLGLERAVIPHRRGENVRVDENGALHSSSTSAGANALRSSSVGQGCRVAPRR